MFGKGLKEIMFSCLSDQNSDVHDIKYFRNLLKTETSRLQELCNHWEEVNKTNYLTEEGLYCYFLDFQTTIS